MTERRLRRPPEKDRPPAPDVEAGWPEPRVVAIDRTRALHAFDWGAAAAIAVAVAYGVLWAALDLYLGLIAVGVMGGWLIGVAVRHGAWRGLLHVPSRRLRLLAAVLGIVAWLGGGAVSYAISQALFPDPATPLLERLSFGGFAMYLTQIYDLVHGAAGALMAFVAWRTAG